MIDFSRAKRDFMNKKNSINLSDVYDSAYEQEIGDYRKFVPVLINQVFIRHFIEPGLLGKKSCDEFLNPENHPNSTAFYFIKKLFDYFIDKGNLVQSKDGFFKVVEPIIDDDPDDKILNTHLKNNPDKRIILQILINIRDIIDEVLFKGEDAMLLMANNNFREAMKVWEQLNAYAQVKVPCHHLVLRVIKNRLKTHHNLKIFEGGAGVGAVMRELSKDLELVSQFAGFDQYYFTDISLSLIKISREWLREHLPAESYDKLTFKVVNLDKLEISTPDFVQENTFDLVVFEHVLYDLIDLHKTLTTVRKMLKPDGVLVFTMAYRLRPKDFFPFEFMQSTFQSYYTAKLEAEYRENIGYLTIGEWEKSLERAGYGVYEVYPDRKDIEKWPYGGIVAYPSPS